jgi:AI-2E family transporter
VVNRNGRRPPGLADATSSPRIECRGPGLTDAFDRWQQRLQQILSGMPRVCSPACSALARPCSAPWILDLVLVIGSTIAGLVACLVALSVSLPVCLATIGFFLIYRLVKDYLLVPRVFGRMVQVPALVTVVAVLLGGALLGIVGALVAILAAALLLLARKCSFPP